MEILVSVAVGIAVFFVCYILPVKPLTRSEAIFNTGNSMTLMFLAMGYEWILAHIVAGVAVGLFAPAFPIPIAMVATACGGYYGVRFLAFDAQLVNVGVPDKAWIVAASVLSGLSAATVLWLG